MYPYISEELLICGRIDCGMLKKLWNERNCEMYNSKCNYKYNCQEHKVTFTYKDRGPIEGYEYS